MRITVTFHKWNFTFTIVVNVKKRNRHSDQ